MSWVYSLSFGPSSFWRHLIGCLLELLRPLLTSRSSSHCRPFRHQARSPQVRTHSFIAQPPDLRRPTLGHKSFAVSCPLALGGNALYPVLVHRLTIYAPRFLPTLGRPYAVALHFAHCDQLAGGLAPPGVRPCWAHMQKARHYGQAFSKLLVAGALSNIAWKPLRHNKTEKISNRVTPSVTPNLTVVARFDS